MEQPSFLSSAIDRLAPFAHADNLNDSAVHHRATLGWAYLELGELDRAQALTDRALSDAQQTGTWLYGALALRTRGLIAARQGDYERAERAYAEGLERVRAMPFPYGEARLLHAYGLLERQRGDQAAAEDKLARALAIFERLGAERDAEALRGLIARSEPLGNASSPA